MNTEKSLHKRAWKMLIMPPLMLLLVCIIFGVVFFFYTGRDGSLIPGYFQTYMPLILAVNHITLFMILRSFLKKDNLTLKDIGWFFDKEKIHIEVLVGLALTFVLYFYNELVVQPIQAYYYGNPHDFSIQFAIRDQIDWPFLVAASTLPIVEELIYRGYAYKGLKRKYGIGFTIIVSSILFGTLHWGLGALTAALIIPFGFFYFLVFLLRKENLVAITFSHLLYNAIVLILI